MKEKIIELGQVCPPMSLGEIGRAVGCSGEYARQVLAAAGITKTRRLRAFHGRAENSQRYAEKVPPASVGAISELTVASDLMIKGYSVFRALSSSAPCDLICFRADTPSIVLKIEVRSAKLNKSGAMQYGPPIPGRYDHLALCLPDGKIVYIPNF